MNEQSCAAKTLTVRFLVPCTQESEPAPHMISDFWSLLTVGIISTILVYSYELGLATLSSDELRNTFLETK